MKNISQKQKGLIVLYAMIGALVLLSVIEGISSYSKKSAKRPQAKFKEPKRIEKLLDIKGLSDTESPKIPRSSKYIARIHINGTIQKKNETYNQKWLIDTIKELGNDKNNMGIILVINSPGGTVYEADEVYLALMDYKEKNKRPIYAYFESLAASGGYYIGCSADYIMANRNTLTGSIGVISGQFVDLSELMKKHGVKITTIHSGRNKIMGSMSEPMTEEQRKIMQSISDECYQQFTEIVSAARDLSIEKTVELADGRIYTANQALKNGLIDSVGSLKQLEELIDRKEFDYNNYEVVDFNYKYEPSFRDLFSQAKSAIESSKAQNNILPSKIEEMAFPDLEFPAYYWNK